MSHGSSGGGLRYYYKTYCLRLYKINIITNHYFLYADLVSVCHDELIIFVVRTIASSLRYFTRLTL